MMWSGLNLCSRNFRQLCLNSEIRKKMKDEKKTKDQLTNELVGLRRRISELETRETFLKRAKQELRKSKEMYRTAFDNTGTATVILEEDTTISLANTEFEKLSGYSRKELEGRKRWTDFVAKEDLERMKEYHDIRRINSSTGPRNYEFRFIDRQKNTKDIFLIITMIPGTKQSVASLADITDRKHMEEELRYLSTHDVLTGLYNRAYFEEEMARLERGRLFPVSVIMIDVDGLKEVNDSQGHAAGDDLLKRTADVLRSVFRAEDVVARVGGDEFSVLLPCTGLAVVEKVALRVRDFLLLHNRKFSESPLSFSLGFAMGGKGCSLVQVQNEADKHMYRDKLLRLKKIDKIF